MNDVKPTLEQSFQKITVGFVIQTYTKQKNDVFACTDQAFIASEDVIYENADGEEIEPPEHPYQSFNMQIIQSLDDDSSWPWCEACKSYHHPKNITCKK